MYFGLIYPVYLMTHNHSAFIYSDQLLQYKFSDNHPFNPLRLTLTLDLLRSTGAINGDNIYLPRMATDEEISLIHDPDYIEAVKLAGKGKLERCRADNHGLGTEDTPIFPNMHEASANIVGGTLTAVDLVMKGHVDHALNLSGGLHHGFRGKASGFCIYNDSSVAIQYLREKFNARVLYVDTDAHHGDGVQWAFYDDPNVCTLSIHETGRYLFPGTGNIYERGQGQGYETAFNVPVDAFTEDESFLALYEKALTVVAGHFKPDVIVTQNGVDAHCYDPLTHLSVTTKTFRRIPQIAHTIAHQLCEGRWIAVGGGGYDIWRAVPRAWSMIWLAMNEWALESDKIPETWIDKWKKKAPVSLPSTWEDPEGLYPDIPRKPEITDKNEQTLQKALAPILPLKQ
jgi:acetoin utilization protein AcuC